MGHRSIPPYKESTMRVLNNASSRMMSGEIARCTSCYHRFSTEAAARRVTHSDYLFNGDNITCPMCGTAHRPIEGGGAGHYVQAQRYQRKKTQLRKENRCPDWMWAMHTATYVHGWRGVPLP